MKNILMSRICCLTIICFFGISPTAYLRAQQAVDVTPEVKADTLRRLELAKSWLIPSSDDWINPTDAPKGNIKEARNLCNKGPHGSDDETQQAGCLNFLMWTKYNHMISASLDQLMPVFKLCAVGGQDDCRRTMEYLLQTGHPDYSLAVAEYAPTCNRCFALWNFSLGPDGYQIDLSPATIGTTMGEYHVHVTNPSDVINLLQIACLGNGSQLACQWYQQTGVAVSEAQREQAAANQQATEDRAAAARDQQFNRGQQHSQESAQAWNNVVGALNSADATIQHPMQYPAQAPARTPAANQTSPQQQETTSCRNMTSCLRISARYDTEIKTMVADVTNICATAVRATVSVYSHNRSCTQSGTTNIGAGETLTGMGGYTDRNWYSAQADDSIDSGMTGQGCALVVPTDCN
jgi:hypothetical protein